MPSQNVTTISSPISSRFVQPRRPKLFITLAGLAVATSLSTGLATTGAVSNAAPASAPAKITARTFGKVHKSPIASTFKLPSTWVADYRVPAGPATPQAPAAPAPVTAPVTSSVTNSAPAPAPVISAPVAVLPVIPAPAANPAVVVAPAPVISAPVAVQPVGPAPIVINTPVASAPAATAPVVAPAPVVTGPVVPTPVVVVPVAPVVPRQLVTEQVDPLDVLEAAQQIAEQTLLAAQTNQQTAQTRLTDAQLVQDQARDAVAQATASLTAATTEWNFAFSRYQQRLANAASELAAAQGVLDVARNNLAAAEASLATTNSNIGVIQQQLTQVRTQIDNAPTTEVVDWSVLNTAEIEAIAESMLIEKINTYRVNAGVAPLPMADRYNREAQYWSDQMAADGYMRHDTGARYDNENIAQIYVRYDDPEAAATYMANRIFDLWKDSPTHNAGMLRGTPNMFGVGIHYDTATDKAWATLRGYVVRVDRADAWLPTDAESAYGVTGLDANTDYTGTDVRTQRNTVQSAPTKAAVAVATTTVLADPDQVAALESQAAELSNELDAAIAARGDAVQDVAAKRAEVTTATADVSAAQSVVDEQYVPQRAEVEAAEQYQAASEASQAVADAGVAQAQVEVAAADQAVVEAQAGYDQAVQDVAEYAASQAPATETDPVDQPEPLVESEPQPEADAEEQPQADTAL